METIRLILRAILYALGATALSIIALTVAYGLPTKERLIEGSLEIYLVAFIVFLWSFLQEAHKSKPGS